MRCGRPGGRSRILLNRSQVINVLTGHMANSILAQLQDWAKDGAVVALSIQAPASTVCGQLAIF
jgi:enoyl-CoA hydratase/carnithine racemase